jgi:hypothetical protein
MSGKKRTHGGHWHAPTKKKKKVAAQQAVVSVEPSLKTTKVKPANVASTPEHAVPMPKLEAVNEALTTKYQGIITDIKLIGKLAAAAVILLIVLSFII